MQRATIETTPRIKKRGGSTRHAERRNRSRRNAQEETVASQTIVSMQHLHWTEPVVVKSR